MTLDPLGSGWVMLQVIHDTAEEFWASSGVVRALQGYDVSLVESALQTRHSQHRPETEQNRLQVGF